MSGFSRFPGWSSGLLALLLLAFPLATPLAVQAQGKKEGETVRVTTIDGVDLHGTFYPSAAKNAPTVLILHALGEDSKKKGYQELALELKQKFCVMTFDFRGHGLSKDVEPAEFWKQAQNLQLVKGGPKSASIDYKDFNKAYYPYLINDIAAVKGFLDRKNDLGACNTSNFIVIGSETGATLGSVWLNSEWHLHKMQQNVMFGGLTPTAKSEGKDTIAAVWISITPSLGGSPITLSTTLDLAGKQNNTPMLFVYGEEDKKGADLAKSLERAIKGTNTTNPKYKYTGPYPVANTKLTGQNLLQKSLGTSGNIAAYLEKIVDERGNEWTEREFRKTQFGWRIPGSTNYKAAKPLGETNFLFNDYRPYITAK